VLVNRILDSIRLRRNPLAVDLSLPQTRHSKIIWIQKQFLLHPNFYKLLLQSFYSAFHRKSWLTTIDVDEVVEAVEVTSTTASVDIEVSSLQDLNESMLTIADDDFDDRRAQRRRYEEPIAVTLRKQVLSIAESVSRVILAMKRQVLTQFPACPTSRRRCYNDCKDASRQLF
jgi:hypothetical protein